MVAGQAIRYIANVPLTPDQLEHYYDLFDAQQSHFSETYIRNVVTKAEWARFKNKTERDLQGGSAKEEQVDLIFAAYAASKQGMQAADYT